MKIRILAQAGESHSLSEDFHLFQYYDGKIKAAVGDWANNLVGGPFLALSLGIIGLYIDGGV